MPIHVTLTLENNGSVARDHLASERTFLAYVRTSLALASTGVALVQLFSISTRNSDGTSSPNANPLHIYARPLGATAILIGLLVLAIGSARFFTVQAKLTRGVFPVARIVTVGAATCIAALIAVVFALIVAKE